MPAYTQSTLCGVSPTTTICPKLTAVGKTKGFSRLQVPKPSEMDWPYASCVTQVGTLNVTSTRKAKLDLSRFWKRFCTKSQISRKSHSIVCCRLPTCTWDGDGITSATRRNVQMETWRSRLYCAHTVTTYRLDVLKFMNKSRYPRTGSPKNIKSLTLILQVLTILFGDIINSFCFTTLRSLTDRWHEFWLKMASIIWSMRCRYNNMDALVDVIAWVRCTKATLSTAKRLRKRFQILCSSRCSICPFVMYLTMKFQSSVQHGNWHVMKFQVVDPKR